METSAAPGSKNEQSINKTQKRDSETGNYWINLPHRRLLRLCGHEVFSFLQGISTQDVMAFKNPLRPFFSAVLAPSGKFLSDFFCIPLSTRNILIDYDEIHHDTLMGLIHQLGCLHQVYIEEITPALTVCTAIGEQASCVMETGTLIPHAASSFPFFQEHSAYIKQMPIGLLYQDPRHLSMGIRGCILVQHLHTLPSPVLMPALPGVYHAWRLSKGIPEGACDLVPNKSIILEYGYQHLAAISWTKGCYMGQELMARTYHRGQLHKAPFRLFKHSGLFPKAQTVLMHEDKKIGVMASANGQWALACLYIDQVQEIMGGNPIVFSHADEQSRHTDIASTQTKDDQHYFKAEITPCSWMSL